MSISLLIDAISKLTQGEIEVLKEVLSAIRQDVDNANNSATTAVLWAQYSLKSQRNVNANFKDPVTGLPIVEPEYQTVDGYPIIFGNADSPGTPARSTTFAFGSKAFLGYENDATGTPYIDLNYVGNTAHDLSEIEVVNYRTLMNAISLHGGNLNQTYVIKQGDSVPNGATHIFSNLFIRDKGYYSETAIPGREFAVIDDINELHNTVTNETYYYLDNLHNTITGEVNLGLNTKLNKSGGVITGSLDVETRSFNDNGVVRNIDLQDLSNVYINKNSDATPGGSTHEFGAVYFRGGSEKVYYGDSEIATQYYTNSTIQETIQGLMKRIEFRTPGTYTWNSGNSTVIEVFQIGGGGGTGASNGGGGGGGLKTKLSILPNTDYTIIVGAGGTPNNDGEDTSFSGEIGSIVSHYTKTLTAVGGKSSGIGGNVTGLKTISGSILNANSDFSIEFGLPYGILDVVYAPGAGGADTIGMAGSIGMYSGGANKGGGASAFGNGSIEGCTNLSPDADQAGIGGGAGKDATTNGGDGILIINTFI